MVRIFLVIIVFLVLPVSGLAYTQAGLEVLTPFKRDLPLRKSPFAYTRYKYIICILFFFSFLYGRSQNLVPNPSFEYIIGTCPNGIIEKAYPWFNPTTSSPDIYHPCWTIDTIARTGVTNAGIFVYQPAGLNVREYIETPLLDTLTTGKKYCVEFYVLHRKNTKFVIADIGLYFSTDSIYSNNYGNLPYQPQIINPPTNVLKDTNWVLISGEYIAQGGEQFITIGNFYTDSNTTIDSFPIGGIGSYYLIDDISVYCCDAGVAVANAGNDAVVCFGDSINIGSPGISGCSYQWQPSLGLSDTTSPQPNAFPQTNTTYYLTVKDTTTGSCQYPVKDSVTIFVVNLPTANTGNDIMICENSSIQIGASSISGYTYYWQPATGLSDVTIAQPTASPAQNAIYILTVNDTANICPITSDSISIDVIMTPIAFAGSEAVICEDSSIQIGTSGVPGYKYSWQPTMGLNDATFAKPTANPIQTITYILTVNDSGNYCSPAIDSVTVSVLNCDTLNNNIFLPTIFSPNGDGHNDIFRVRGNKIAECYLAIYNRWGEKIFDLRFTKDDLNDVTKWWDGTQNGEPLNTGVFVYFLKVTYEDGKTEEMKGNVTLIK